VDFSVLSEGLKKPSAGRMILLMRRIGNTINTKKLIEAFAVFCDLHEQMCEEICEELMMDLDPHESTASRKEIEDTIFWTTGDVKGALGFLQTCKARELLSQSQYECLREKAKATIGVMEGWLDKTPPL